MDNDSKNLCEYSMYKCVIGVLEEHANDDVITSSVCQCLPSCDSVQYEAEVAKTEYDEYAFLKAHAAVQQKIVENLNLHHFISTERDWVESRYYTKIKMYFKEPRIVSMRCSELFGLTNFLANCGGLLGLFLGFSFLSFVEIFYFFTLRLGCMFKRNNKTKKKKDVGIIKNH